MRNQENYSSDEDSIDELLPKHTKTTSKTNNNASLFVSDLINYLNLSSSDDEFYYHDYDYEDSETSDDMQHGQLITLDQSSHVSCLTTTNDNEIICGLGLGIKIWNLNTNTCLLEIHCGSSSCLSLVKYTDTRFIGGFDDGTIRVFDTTNGTCLKKFRAHNDNVTDLFFKYSDILLSVSLDGSSRTWGIIETEDGRYHFDRCGIDNDLGLTRCIIYSRKFKLKILGTDKEIHIWNKDGENIETLRAFSDVVLSLELNIDNDQFISGHGNGNIFIWSLRDRECLSVLNEFTGGVYSLLVYRRNNWLISGFGDGTIRILDLDTEECIESIEAHDDVVNSLVLSKAGYLISGSGDETIKGWDLDEF
jgi:WD40 repeat protein